MSVGWGFRGDYGHEWGAMVPGALLGLSVCLASGREDWWKRASLLAMLGAIGWGFGGKMSYAKIVGYTASTYFPDVAYGYACLFAIGALWAGIGAAFLGLAVTRPRSYFHAFAAPLAVVYLLWNAWSCACSQTGPNGSRLWAISCIIGTHSGRILPAPATFLSGSTTRP